jgi:hypothetical protein
MSAELLIGRPLDMFPLGVLYILMVVLLFLAAEGGYYLSRFTQRRTPDQAQASVGSLNGATLALLAFLMALVTSNAVNSFSARRQAVVAEANAIGTTYLRAGYLPDPYAEESRELLREYVDQRLEARDPAKTAQVLARSEEIHTELWARAETLARESPTPLVSLYIASLNEVIDLHTNRINVEFVARLPWVILAGLFIIALLAMGLVGIYAGYSEKRNLIALIAFILTLAVVFILNIDSGRNQTGLLRVSQQAMLDLHRSITP